MPRLDSIMLVVAFLAANAACSEGRGHVAASADDFTLLALPGPGVGKCERGPFRGDFMEIGAVPGWERIALEVGSVRSPPSRSVRVILDSTGKALSFRDQIVYDDSAASIVVSFQVDGSVAEGMEHHHREGSPKQDWALEPGRYSDVVQTARRLRERCGASDGETMKNEGEG